jgi:hypothetical protein
MKHQVSQMMFKKYINSKMQLPAYNPAADFKWIQTQSGLPWLQLDIEVPHQKILTEILNIQELLSDHRDTYGEHHGWQSFCIHGKRYDATREDSYYNDTRPYIWTPEAIKLMPETVKYFSENWPKVDFARVRVMLLDPGGYVSAHTDTDISHLWPINIAITQPTDCNFVMEKHGIVPFEPGQANWLDISNRHTVFNNSNEKRWHIIVHQSFDNIEFQNLVVNSYKMLYNKINENSQNNNS